MHLHQRAVHEDQDVLLQQERSVVLLEHLLASSHEVVLEKDVYLCQVLFGHGVDQHRVEQTKEMLHDLDVALSLGVVPQGLEDTQQVSFDLSLGFSLEFFVGLEESEETVEIEEPDLLLVVVVFRGEPEDMICVEQKDLGEPAVLL